MDIDNKLIIKSKLEFKEYKSAIKGIRIGRTIIIASIYFFILIIDLYGILTSVGDIENGNIKMMVNGSLTKVPIYIAFLPTIFFFVLIGLVLLVIRFSFLFSIKSKYYSNIQIQKETDYIFMREGVEAINNISSKKVSWEEFYKIKETKKAILLFLSKKELWIIPLNRFTNEELVIFNQYASYKSLNK